MNKKIARIITDQIAADDPSTVDVLRSLAGMPVREVQARQHFTRVRVLDIQRDQFGNVIGSHEHVEEHESGESFSAWAQ